MFPSAAVSCNGYILHGVVESPTQETHIDALCAVVLSRFITCVGLCNHHGNQGTEHKGLPCATGTSLSPTSPNPLATTHLFSMSIILGRFKNVIEVVSYHM